MAPKKQNPSPTSDPPPLPPNRNAAPEPRLSFEEMLLQAMHHTMIDFVRKGEWFKLEYGARVNLDAAWLRELHSRVDMSAVMENCKQQVEQKIADGIMNSMQQEIANDIKSIMGNRELREDIRAVIREKIRSCQQALSKE